MTSLFSSTGMTAALAIHLWQSTAFAGAAWLITLALRRYPARIRFSVWMIACLKFLVPFAMLTSLGAHWARPITHPQTRRVFYTLIEDFGQSFAQGPNLRTSPAVPGNSAHAGISGFEVLAIVWLCGCLVMLVRWALQWTRVRKVTRGATPVYEGREILALSRAQAGLSSRRTLPILLTPRAMEPGIFGVIRPVLLWPERLSQQLDDLEIEAILVHELEHVRRRDNLVSTIEALVKALFWFHPAVHWMGARMSEERERACDERVIEHSAHPEKYAKSILAVCAFCLESPLACVAGVSGSDLKKRILRIMNHRSGVALTIGRRAVLAAAAALVLTLPIGFGMLRGQVQAEVKPAETSPDPRDVPKYEVASVKPASSNDDMSRLMATPDGISIHGVPAQMLLRFAFGMEADRIVGAPSWASSNRYDIEAKVAPEDAPKLDKLKGDDRRAMLLPVLVERFNLKYHHETRELPMFTLVVAKGGSKLTAAKEEPAPSPGDPPSGPRDPKGPIGMRGRMMMGPGRVEAQGSTLDMLAHSLSAQVGHTVVDKTGLTGKYDFTLQWTPDDGAMPMPGGAGGPAKADAGSDPPQVGLFTAIQEQLGLKLESEKGKVDVIVIDHIDLPSAN